ncbi:hypothetical protein [Nocardia harenae]|uniref:hypothetical protein n=1 Tax=Nocardia harenae TaxID=358707 RepID=UPI000A05C956|nr:hypothetical protein [Nocardia harenae]
MWFGLAAIALVGAVVLLYFDRAQRQRTGHARQVWAKAQGYTYVSVEPALPSTWRRGALAKLGYLSAVDVVSGIRKGEKFVLFDLEDSATLIAVRRQIGSDIDVDMRLKTASPPKDADLELLGAIGDRVVFATNPEIARHAVDQRMVAFIESLPDIVQMLWSEGNWTLGMLSIGTGSRDWETSIDAVLRLSGLLHVLPPESDTYGDGDFGRPGGRAKPRRGDDADDPAGNRGAAAESADRPRGDERPAADPGAEPGQRRPSLAVVPGKRDEPRRQERPGGPEPDADGDEPGDRPGGPFHPGFRPYQGPVPQ